MDLRTLRRLLLELVGTARKPDLGQLDAPAWARLDRMAAQHRLQPLLYARQRASPGIPEATRAGWRAAHRIAAMQAMVQQAELAETCALLEAEGFAPIALKGGWLARAAYPEPAQRPMRDIDLLVAPDLAIPAYEALLAAGFTPARECELPIEDVVRLDKHMPPLVAPRGTPIELHHRLWERDGRLDHASPDADEAAVRSRAVVDSAGLRYLAPQDMLVHLIVHAVYSHRLDCGPLVLADIAFLLQVAQPDWLEFWAAAERQGWRGGARLVLELVARYRPDAAIDFSDDRGGPAPAELLDSAPDLLLQELDTRASAGFAASTLKGGVPALAARLAGRREAAGQSPAQRTMANGGGFLGWAGSRTARSLRDLAQPEVRRQSRQLAALSRWLDA